MVIRNGFILIVMGGLLKLKDASWDGTTPLGPPLPLDAGVCYVDAKY